MNIFRLMWGIYLFYFLSLALFSILIFIATFGRHRYVDRQTSPAKGNTTVRSITM